MKCWNCLKNQPKKTHNCTDCGQPLKPNPMQKTAATGRVDFLLGEAREWDFLPAKVRSELMGVYRARRDRLQNITKKAAAKWPETDWTSPVWSAPETPTPPLVEPAEPTPRLDPKTVSQKLKAISEVSAPVEELEGESVESAAEDAPEEAAVAEVASEASPTEADAEEPPSPEKVAPKPALFTPRTSIDTAAAPASPSALDQGMAPVNTYANKVLAEADIRWFHSLGALLVIAAVVGWLVKSWDSYGKGLTGILIVTSPIVLHGLAASLRKSVPLSARLLGLLAGVLTAPALLAMHLFGFLPAGVDFANYWTFSLVLSSIILGIQANAHRETLPLYMGAICAVLAGWSQGALWVSGISLAVGVILSRIAPQNLDSDEERAWKGHLTRLSMAAGCFGSFATLALFQEGASPYAPMVMFTGALMFLHMPTLTRDAESNNTTRVLLQAGLTVVGLFLMRFVMEVPSSAAGLYALFATALFLSARPDDEAGLLALRCGSVLGFLGIAMGYIPNLGSGAGQGLTHNALRLTLGVVGAAFFAVMSRKKHLATQRDALGVLALLSLTRGWFRFFLSLCEGERGYFDHAEQLTPLMGSFGVLIVLILIASRLLEPRERDLAQGFASVLIAATFVFNMMSALGAEFLSPLWALVAGSLGIIALLWERGLLVPKTFTDNSPMAAVEVALPVMLPRIAVWSLTIAFVLWRPMDFKPLVLLLEGVLLAGLLAAWKNYRGACFETAWVLSLPALVVLWDSNGPQTQFLVPVYLLVLSWASERLRGLSFVSTAMVTGCVMLLSIDNAPLGLLLVQPVLFALAYIAPVPGRGEWKSPGIAHWGFDLLLNGTMLVTVLRADHDAGSAASLTVTALFPLLGAAMSFLSRQPLASRVIHSWTGPILMGTGLFWTFEQGPKESGLLLLAGAGVLLFNKSLGKSSLGLERFDLANGLAIVGLTWLCSEHHIPLNTLVLLFALLLSEIGSLLLKPFKPNLSNAVLLFGGLMLTLGDADPSIRGIGLLAGAVAATRGLVQTQFMLMGSGVLMMLRFADSTLVNSTSDLKIRLLPTVIGLIAASLYLWSKEDHPSRKMLGCSPAALLQVALALNAIPALLAFTLGEQLWENFAWALGSGVLYLLASAMTSGVKDLSGVFRQAGGYALTGWAVVALGRGAMQLPWQAATLVVGLVLVGAGVMAEKGRRKKPE